MSTTALLLAVTAALYAARAVARVKVDSDCSCVKGLHRKLSVQEPPHKSHLLVAGLVSFSHALVVLLLCAAGRHPQVANLQAHFSNAPVGVSKLQRRPNALAEPCVSATRCFRLSCRRPYLGSLRLHKELVVAAALCAAVMAP